MKSKLLALFFLAGTSLLAGPRVYFGVGFGGYYPPAPVAVYGPPPPVAYYAPASPRPGYSWIDGYWYPVGPRYSWRAGYWAPRPYVSARWIAPRYYGHRYYGGYWRR